MKWLSYSFLGTVLALALSGPGLAQDAPGRLNGLQLSGDQPIQVDSDRLEVRENENVGIFSGNVTVRQGDSLLKSGHMTVHYLGDGGSATTGSAQIERIEVDGNVYLKSGQQVATADRGTFNMQTEVLVLSGDEVVLSEGDNVIVGCKLTVQMKSGEAKLDGCADGESGSGGRVRMLLTPDAQNGAQNGQ